jgi:hypothetical protein
MVSRNTQLFSNESDESSFEEMTTSKFGKSCNSKFRNRRFKANARERNRMHSLNDALDKLRKCVPIENITIGSNPGK